MTHITLEGITWGVDHTHHILKGTKGAKYTIDYRPIEENEHTQIWIWERRRNAPSGYMARYRLKGTIEQQVEALVRLAFDYNGATVRVDLTMAGTAIPEILEERGVKVETYYTVSHVGQRE